MVLVKLYESIKRALLKKLFSANRWVESIGVEFGQRCQFNKEISFGSEPYLTSIGDDFYCAAGVRFITHDGSVNVLRNQYKELKTADIFGRIFVGNNVFLGCNVIVLAGSVIGDNVIVGAGAVVKGTLEGGFVYAGVPAKKICTIKSYKLKNENKIFLTKNLNKKEKKELLNKEL